MGAGTDHTLYQYSRDKQLTRVTRPDGALLDFGYDAAGRLSTLDLPNGVYRYDYFPTIGQLSHITAPSRPRTPRVVSNSCGISAGGITRGNACERCRASTRLAPASREVGLTLPGIEDLGAGFPLDLGDLMVA